MQSVTHEYKNCNELFDFFENLYFLTSDDSWMKSGALFNNLMPTSFKPILKLFDFYGYKFDFIYDDVVFKPIEFPTNSEDRVIVCVSGGKDSTATVKYYIDNGYKVDLLHIRGLNKCYPDEYKAVRRIAEYFGVPLHEWNVKLHGNHMYTEHPLKNYIMVNVAIHLALEIGVSKIAVGDFATASLDDNRFDISGGDCYELWEIYNNIIGEIIPGFELQQPLFNVEDSLTTFLNDKELLELCQSCIGTFRFREHKHGLMIKKYGVNLMPHRCGCCWKCALEYLYYTDHDVLEFNEGYYKHCLEVLLRNYVESNNLIPYSIYDLWDAYLFYDISESKLKNIGDASVYLRRISYEN